MGLFDFLNNAKKEKKMKENYLLMTSEMLGRLSDNDLRNALFERLRVEQDKLDWDVNKCLQEFKGAKRLYFIVDYFDMEIQNGGLSQFFINSSRDVAPYILDSLKTIGAKKYEILLRNFIECHDIKLNDLDSFIIEDIEEYEAQASRYPFDEFDNKYYDLYEKEPLEGFLINYVKQYLEDF